MNLYKEWENLKSVKYWHGLNYPTPWYFEDMARREHILIGGATGSGKSVALNGLMMYLLTKTPDDVKFILIDPKRVELAEYKNLPHTLQHAHKVEDINKALIFAESLMNKRFEGMEQKGVRTYWGSDVYIVIDEYASVGGKNGRASKRAMESLTEIAYKGRATKIHIVACTQRPTQDVIDGMIQNNFTTTLALRTNKQIESRNLIEYSWCKELPKHGFAYYKNPDNNNNPVKVEIEMVDAELSEKVITNWNRQNEVA